MANNSIHSKNSLQTHTHSPPYPNTHPADATLHRSGSTAHWRQSLSSPTQSPPAAAASPPAAPARRSPGPRSRWGPPQRWARCTAGVRWATGSWTPTGSGRSRTGGGAGTRRTLRPQSGGWFSGIGGRCSLQHMCSCGRKRGVRYKIEWYNRLTKSK